LLEAEKPEDFLKSDDQSQIAWLLEATFDLENG